MNHSTDVRSTIHTDAALSPLDLLQTLRTHVGWWALPTVACAVLAAAYALISPRSWQATQALIIRPEAASVSEERLGKFSDLSEMKTLQETILELAKSPSVVQATLAVVGPPRSYRRPAAWPTPLDVEEFRTAIDMRPPGGAEFGKTEVFYLSIRDRDRNRAGALVAALCGQLERRMQQLRDQRAQGMVAELERTVAMAEADRDAQTQRLSKFEGQIGADLAELRNLNADLGGQSEVAQELQAIETERRANEGRQQANVRLLRLLTAAQHDPQQLLATPNSLLQSQPAVSQLKHALVEAQIRRSNLLGSRSEKHPLVMAAREAEELITQQLHDEVATAIRALEVDIELNATREQALADRWSAARERLARLAGARAEYSNLVTSVANHTRLVEASRKNLADARARQAGARSASVISRIDGVEAGVRPVSPRRTTIVASGGAGGLVLGLGFVFLFAAPASSPVMQRETGDAEPSPSKDPVNTVAAAADHPNGHESTQSVGRFGMFQGMTLEQAMRSVQHRG